MTAKLQIANSAEESTQRKKLSKAQHRVIEALRQPGAHIIEPSDMAGRRTGYVTTGGFKGYICPITLATFRILCDKGIITGPNGNNYRLNTSLKF